MSLAWCDPCLADHDGPCLAERRRLDVRDQLAAHVARRRPEPCPFCGGRGAGGPYGYVARTTVCTYCRGSGRIR